jgi:flagellar hook-basal body complex protein FliE
MQRLSAAASQSGVTAREQTQAVGFKNALTEALAKVNDAQMQAGEMSDKVMKGDPSVTLAQAMLANQKASVAFEATVQVRNRLVQAYQDIMNMPI